MADLSILAWVLLALAAAIVGLSKTAIPGAATIAVAIFAAVLPARQSTGTLLLLLIVADVFALAAYRRHANMRALLRLAPAVVVGVGLGVVFLAVADDGWVKRVIGVILLAVIAITLIRRRSQRAGRDAAIREAGAGTAGTATGTTAANRATGTNLTANRGGQLAAAATFGTLGGFTTMVANAGGPVMSMYFLAARFEVKEFLGTAAWFFALVNLAKLPFSIGLGLITVPGLLIDLALVPLVIGGAFFGRWLAGKLDQRLFERLVIVFTLVGAVYLLV